MGQKIVPHLWFDKEAREAAEFYCSIFPDSKITNLTTLHDTPSGTVDVVTFELTGQSFMAISAGPVFKFNEAISFVVNCDNQEEIDYYWERLSAVPESDLPAPRPDKFYVYVVLCGNGSMYIGQTEDLRKRWQKHQAGTAAGHTKRHIADHIIHFEEFSSREEAVKREHDLKTGFGRKWLKREFKAGRTRQAGQCGWLKDKYGVSWQIVPEALGEMMGDKDEKRRARVTEAFLKMKKFDIAKLRQAYEGR